MKIKFPKIVAGDFYEVINKAIKENRHVDYLENVLKEYEDYQKFFEKVFIEANESQLIYVFRADYLSKKTVWRDIMILGGQTLEDLAGAVIFSMDWGNDHMHGFSFPKEQGKKNFDFFDSPFVIYSPGWEDDPSPTFKTNEIKICQINWELYPKLQFIFDFGDGHLFDIVLKQTVTNVENELEKTFPRLIDQRGIAPEQYPDFEDEFEGEEIKSEDLFSEDCKLCQDLKNQGAELQWFPDHPLHKKRVVH